MVKCGIVGLANVGKSTLFNALLKKSASARALVGQAGHAKTANYPFTTIEPNVGVVEVPDSRLTLLAEVISQQLTVNSEQKMPPIVPAVVQFVDIAGLVKDAHKGEGLGNRFLSHIREVDLIVFVVRDFSDSNVIKTGSDPKEDLDVLKSELLLKDLETLEKRIDSLQREVKPIAGNDLRKSVLASLEKAKAQVEKGEWLAETLLQEELDTIADLQLLSAKKTIVVENCDEKDLGEENIEEIGGAIWICAKMEEELVEISGDEQRQYLKELGIGESGLNQLIKKAYEVLSLMSFYTAGPKEVRAWTIQKGSLAPQAAGVIHTDFERGFIAADVVPYDKFVDAGGWKGAREKGFVRIIGKSEVMPEDVVVEFKFSV